MPYIATDLDAFDNAQGVAGAIGLPLQHVLGALALLWRWCWRQKVDRVTPEQLAAHFGSTNPALPGALSAFGFLEAVEVGAYRVRGVARYLRISDVRRKGGKARAAASKRSATGQLLSSSQPAHAGQPASTTPAADQPFQRAATSEQRISSSPSEKNPPASPADDGGVLQLHPIGTDKPTRKPSEAEEFWAWYQNGRTEKTGLVREGAPDVVALRKWFKAAVSEVTLARLYTAAARYVTQPKDDYWRQRGFPFQGFMSDAVWRKYVPPEERSG